MTEKVPTIAIGSVNSTVGACRSNVDRAIGLARAAAEDGATLVALPEQLIGGYPPEDLILKPFFHDEIEKIVDSQIDCFQSAFGIQG